ncbi:hypothetical protein R6Q59_000150 [Mikania micrantha]
MSFLVRPSQRFPTSLSAFFQVFLNWKSKNKSLHFFGGAEQSKNETDQMIVLEWLFLTIAPCDAAEPWQLGSQDAATPMMQGIIDLHHDIFFFLILILVFVSRILVRALWHFQKIGINLSVLLAQRFSRTTTTIFMICISLSLCIMTREVASCMDGAPAIPPAAQGAPKWTGISS